MFDSSVPQYIIDFSSLGIWTAPIRRFNWLGRTRGPLHRQLCKPRFQEDLSSCTQTQFYGFLSFLYVYMVRIPRVFSASPYKTRPPCQLLTASQRIQRRVRSPKVALVFVDYTLSVPDPYLMQPPDCSFTSQRNHDLVALLILIKEQLHEALPA
jgi:hypothetical protein